MSHYVIGDVQGCFDELVLLCKKIKFNPNKDKLIFAGDLVNRGPKSLEVLNFCLENKNCVTSVLGNHDFYLMYLLEHKKKNKSAPGEDSERTDGRKILKGDSTSLLVSTFS